MKEEDDDWGMPSVLGTILLISPAKCTMMIVHLSH